MHLLLSCSSLHLHLPAHCNSFFSCRAVAWRQEEVLVSQCSSWVIMFTGLLLARIFHGWKKRATYFSICMFVCWHDVSRVVQRVVLCGEFVSCSFFFNNFIFSVISWNSRMVLDRCDPLVLLWRLYSSSRIHGLFLYENFSLFKSGWWQRLRREGGRTADGGCEFDPGWSSCVGVEVSLSQSQTRHAPWVIPTDWLSPVGVWMCAWMGAGVLHGAGVHFSFLFPGSKHRSLRLTGGQKRL